MKPDMVKNRPTWIGAAAFAGFVLISLAGRPASAQDVDCPSDDWLATTAPVYYDGQADYWYDNHWCYRYGGGWAVYAVEPSFLLGYRNRGQPRRTFFEGRGGARGGGGQRGGGARGGGGGGRRR